MGYTTEFSGELLFVEELRASELAKLNQFLGEDCRQHPEWGNTGLTYIDLELTKDFSGLKWNGAEKTYDLVDKVNFIIEEMQKVYPDFELTGELLAQGEEIGDVWRLVMENNVAYERKIDLSHKRKVTCPHCEEEFFLEEEKVDVNNSIGENCVFAFSGFRDEDLFAEVVDKGHTMSGDFSKKVTHLVMKDVSVNSTKKQKAQAQGCKIWSINDLKTFLNLT